MKDDPAIRDWISETVDKYYKQLGITLQKPEVLYDLTNASKVVLSHPTAKRYKRYAAVSVFHPSDKKKPSWMIINLEYHSSIAELEDTIAHELLHFRFPKMEHGEDFWKMLGMVLMGKHYHRNKK